MIWAISLSKDSRCLNCWFEGWWITANHSSAEIWIHHGLLFVSKSCPIGLLAVMAPCSNSFCLLNYNKPPPPYWHKFVSRLVQSIPRCAHAEVSSQLLNLPTFYKGYSKTLEFNTQVTGKTTVSLVPWAGVELWHNTLYPSEQLVGTRGGAAHLHARINATM